jgi:hypothetical protein
LADGRIAAALKQHEKLFTEAVGEALGEICEGLGNEFRKELQAATGKLGVELRELNAGLRTELARHETELARPAVWRGTSSSISPGESCPSDCANGRTGSDQ